MPTRKQAAQAVQGLLFEMRTTLPVILAGILGGFEMSKIDIIDYCGDCSKRYYKVNDLYCEPEEKETYENSPIPDWCPLPDSED